METRSLAARKCVSKPMRFVEAFQANTTLPDAADENSTTALSDRLSSDGQPGQNRFFSSGLYCTSDSEHNSFPQSNASYRYRSTRIPVPDISLPFLEQVADLNACNLDCNTSSNFLAENSGILSELDRIDLPPAPKYSLQPSHRSISLGYIPLKFPREAARNIEPNREETDQSALSRCDISTNGHPRSTVRATTAVGSNIKDLELPVIEENEEISVLARHLSQLTLATAAIQHRRRNGDSQSQERTIDGLAPFYVDASTILPASHNPRMSIDVMSEITFAWPGRPSTNSRMGCASIASITSTTTHSDEYAVLSQKSAYSRSVSSHFNTCLAQTTSLVDALDLSTDADRTIRQVDVHDATPSRPGNDSDSEADEVEVELLTPLMNAGLPLPPVSVRDPQEQDVEDKHEIPWNVKDSMSGEPRKLRPRNKALRTE